ncbi:hypothetical protein [Pseudoroseomonas cervicalis]|uniref:hypothetical protein n=1 Tax=Teichococcus cervicalis TaxID=204525 RepID=UPI00277E16AC|nr:hypothetical protein [Pseudoroseomonas cervicalis]MDQ1077688.1 DevC protein [Pseudoroseomonas cervicalis]
MRLATTLWLPLRLAWRQLRADKARLATAIAGVLFACVLVFMQLGFRAALFDSATSLITAMRGEVFLIHPMTLASFRPEPLPRVRASQALALPEVAQSVPIYMAQSTWRNPETGERRTIQLVGFDVEAGAMRFEGLERVAEALKRPDTVAFDRRSRPEFGPVEALLAGARRQPAGADQQPADRGGGGGGDRRLLRRRWQCHHERDEFPPPDAGTPLLQC